MRDERIPPVVECQTLFGFNPRNWPDGHDIATVSAWVASLSDVERHHLSAMMDYASNQRDELIADGWY